MKFIFTLCILVQFLNLYSQDLDSIIFKVQKTYRDFESYKDIGTFSIDLIRHTDEQGPKMRGSFSTEFNRTENSFLFQFKKEISSPSYEMKLILLKESKSDSTLYQLYYNDIEQEHKFVRLDRAVAKSAGITNGISSFISILLMPDQISGNNSFNPINKFTLLESKELKGINCYRLKINYKTDRPKIDPPKEKSSSNSSFSKEYIGEEIIWIDQETFLIHLIEENKQLSRSQSKKLIEYSPSLR